MPDAGRRFPAAILMVFVLAAFTAGCGDSKLRSNNSQVTLDAGNGGSPDALEGPDPELQDFALNTSEALCEKIFECCTPEERQAELGVNAETVADCVNQGAFFAFAFGYGQLDESVKEERILIDSQMAEMCVQSIANTSCTDFNAPNTLQANAPGCREVFAPQADLGDLCEVDQDCKQGFCYGSSQSGARCTELPQQGEPCPALNCAQGSYCDSFDTVCEPAKSDGEPCFERSECLSGYCLTDADGSKTCGEPAAICNDG